MSARPHWLRGYRDERHFAIDEHAQDYVPPPLPRFSRTLGEQMPKDAIYAHAVERPRPRPRSRIVEVLRWIAGGALFAAAFSAAWWLRWLQ